MFAERVQSDIDLPGTPPGLDVGARPSPQQLEEALAGIKSAGALFPGDALVYQVGARQVSPPRCTSSLTSSLTCIKSDFNLVTWCALLYARDLHSLHSTAHK